MLIGLDIRRFATTFKIQPHTRIQEWVALEKGYFSDEGLDYELEKSFVGVFRNPGLEATDALVVEIQNGAFEDMESGRECDISSACHWAVNMASSAEHGRMWGHAYAVTPSGIWVPPESNTTTPEQLAGVEVAVGFHSGSHFSAMQYLESYLTLDKINLKFVGGAMDRMQLLLDRRVPAGNVFGTASYVLEQQGFRKVIDTSFMIGFLIQSGATDEDAQKYFNALQRAQRDIDIAPELYKHYLLDELPEEYRDMVDTRRCGIGERLVFEPYTREMYEKTHRWMVLHELFPSGQEGKMQYEVAVIG